MNSAEVLDISKDALWVVILITFPIMFSGMFFGLIMSFVQAITQIQEPTLSFIPKMIAIFLALLVLMPFIGRTMLSFTERIVLMIQSI